MPKLFNAAILLALWPGSAGAEGVQQGAAQAAQLGEAKLVRGSRIELVEILPNSPAELHAIDLGSAPAAGATRLVSKADILREVRAAGFDPASLELPHVVRVKSPGEKLTREALSERLKPRVIEALPKGATLTRLEASVELTLSPEVQFGSVQIPKLPKRVGAVRTSISVELLREGRASQRVPLIATLSLSSTAASYAVPQGSTVSLLIKRRSASISAQGHALADGDVGDVLSFRVASTGRVVKARLESTTSALVVEML